MKKQARKQNASGWGALILSTIVGAVLLVVIAFTSFGTAGAASADKSPHYKIRDKRVLSLTSGMIFMNDVPETLPAQGVALLDGSFILKPLTPFQQQRIAVSQSSAITTAQPYSPAQNTPSALLASFTAVGTLPVSGDSEQPQNPIQERAVWVVTFTSTTPLDLPGSPHTTQKQSFYHVNVVIDAASGKFLMGFYTS